MPLGVAGYKFAGGVRRQGSAIPHFWWDIHPRNPHASTSSSRQRNPRFLVRPEPSGGQPANQHRDFSSFAGAELHQLPQPTPRIFPHTGENACRELRHACPSPPCSPIGCSGIRVAVPGAIK